jgi:hypothetical protein
MKPLRVRVGTQVYVRANGPSTTETARLLLTVSPRYEEYFGRVAGGRWQLVRPLLTEGPHTISIKWRGRRSRDALTPPAYGLTVTYELAHDTYAVRAWFYGTDANVREQHTYEDLHAAVLGDPATLFSWATRLR